jgi:hypothetical protein
MLTLAVCKKERLRNIDKETILVKMCFIMQIIILTSLHSYLEETNCLLKTSIKIKLLA